VREEGGFPVADQMEEKVTFDGKKVKVLGPTFEKEAETPINWRQKMRNREEMLAYLKTGNAIGSARNGSVVKNGRPKPKTIIGGGECRGISNTQSDIYRKDQDSKAWKRT
jgi:hypothetical protein